MRRSAAIYVMVVLLLWPSPTLMQFGADALAQKRAGRDLADYRIDLFAEPLALDPQSGATRIGALRYIAGQVLVSDNEKFGGFSGLTVSAASTELLAVSDRGHWFRARVGLHRGELALSDAYLIPILNWKGEELTPSDRDAEALAQTNGSIAVAFEGFHRIWRYPVNADRSLMTAAFATARPIAAGGPFELQPSNGGIEALAYLPDGRLFAISEEGKSEDGANRAWLIGSDGVEELSFVPKSGYSPTDIARLPDGDFLVLQRRYTPISGVSASIGRLGGGAIEKGARLQADEIALLVPPMSVDNMESIAVQRDADGKILVYLLSDNNFNALQRTLLLVFELVQDAA